MDGTPEESNKMGLVRECRRKADHQLVMDRYLVKYNSENSHALLLSSIFFYHCPPDFGLLANDLEVAPDETTNLFNGLFADIIDY